MMTPTPPPPAGYHLDAATLGYAIGRLLRHTTFRSNRSLANAARAFLSDTGLNVTAMTPQELEIVFYHVGRGYAEPLSPPTRKRKEAPVDGADHD